MPISSSALVLLASLFFGGDSSSSPESQTAELEKAVGDLEKTQELLRTRQAEARQVLHQVRQRQTTLDALVRRLDLTLKRAAVILDLPQPNRPPSRGPGRQTLVDYKNFKTFEIPFEKNSDRTFRQILLHASTDGRTWTHIATATPSDNRFVYTAPADGWYFFVVQVEELDGSFTPRDLTAVPPALRVCVDTVKPVARLRPVAPRNGDTVAVEWEVSDANLDLRTLTLHYAPPRSERWVKLDIRRLAYAQYGWRPEGTGPFDVRLQVSDLAGNTVTATTTITPGALPGVAGVSPKQNALPRIVFVRSKRFKLHYKTDSESAGPSGVKCVEIWQTRNTKKYEKVKADAPAEGPCEITVASTGRYGFTLRPINGVGRGSRPPAPLQQPQLWVLVDDQAPEVVLHGVVVGEGTDRGTITVNWRASDPWLIDKPITIKYATRGAGPWIDLQSNVENTGTRNCAVPKDTAEFYVRVEAVDQAGNVGMAQTQETVKVDHKLPVIKDDDIEVSASPEQAKLPE